jgi:hypothetical protein
LRNRRAQREQQRERSRARDQKDRSGVQGTLEDIVAHLPMSAYATLDLHGDTRENSRNSITDAVKKAKGKGLKVVRVIHGFNRGSVLSAETQKVLFSLKQQGLVATYAINGSNPGETIVQLA